MQAEKASETVSAAGLESRKGGSAFGRLQGTGQRRVFSGSDVGGSGGGYNGEDDDGSSIMGRAANIANTAKDLLGALWYGANPNTNPTELGGSDSQSSTSTTTEQSKKTARHKRGASMG